jgi:hypothetical protein
MPYPFHIGNHRKNPGDGPSGRQAIYVFLIFVALSLIKVAITLPNRAGGASAPAVSLSPSSLTFTGEAVDNPSSPQVVTLKNTGSAALKISSIGITGANAADFIVNTTCGSSVAAGGNCTIAILHTPAAIGARKAFLAISDNAASSPNTVALSGTGTHDVILAWTSSPTPGVSAYNIFRGTASEGESAKPLNSAPIMGDTFTDGNVTGGATYYYVVTAVASDNVTQSESSNETSATVPGP